MTSNEALYLPDEREIAELCDALRDAGLLGVRVDIEIRLAVVFARLGPRSRAALGHTVHAVCRTAPDRAAFDALVEPWMDALTPIIAPAAPSVSAPPPSGPPPPPDVPRASARPWPVFAVLVAGVSLALMITLPWPPAPTGGPNVGVAAVEGGPSAAPLDVGTDARSPPPAALQPSPQSQPPPRPMRPTLTRRLEEVPGEPSLARLLAALALLVIGLLVALRVRWRRRRARAIADRPPPGGYPPPPVLPRRPAPPTVLPADVGVRLAHSARRDISALGPRSVDVPASVRATAARGGRIPELAFQRVGRVSPFHIWVDAWALLDNPTLARTLDEILPALERAHVEFVRWDFAGVPHRVSDGRATHALGELAADPRTTSVALLTDGAGLLARRARPERARIVDALSRWSNLAIFLFGDRGPRELRAWSGGRLPVYPGQSLVAWLCGAPPPAVAPLDVADLRTWAAACALSPQWISDDDALELREALGLERVSPHELEALRSSADGERLRWSPRQRSTLLGWLRTTSPEPFRHALSWWTRRYHEATRADEPGGPIHFGAASLGLWTDDPGRVPDVAARLFDAQMPAGRPLAYLAPADVALDDARATHLPWCWSALNDPVARARLAILGLAEGVGGLPPATPPTLRDRLARWAATVSLVAAGLGLLLIPPPPTTLSLPCIARAVAAHGRVATVWRCGTRIAPRPTDAVWPGHSSVSIFADESAPGAARLALALLDEGAADAVWWQALGPIAEQRVALLSTRDERPCPAEASACVRTADLEGLTHALGSVVLPIEEVWPETERGRAWMMGGSASPDAGHVDVGPTDTSVVDLASTDTSVVDLDPVDASLVDASGTAPTDAGDPARVELDASRPARPGAAPARADRADRGVPDRGPGAADALADGPPLGPDLCPGDVAADRPTRCRPALRRWSSTTVSLSDARGDVTATLPAYWLSSTEVSEGQWTAVMRSPPGVAFGGDPQRPVRGITWLDAVGFCNRLSEREGRMPAYQVDGTTVRWDRSADGYRLPTEDEWLRVARVVERAAGGDRAAVAWSLEDGFEVPQPVRTGPAVEGMWGVLGNVREWMWDPYGSGPGVRVVRGGSFAGTENALDPGRRVGVAIGRQARDLGVRLARTVKAGE